LNAVSFSEGHSALSGTPEAILWACVVLAAVQDLCSLGWDRNKRQDVESWIGAFPSRDFKLVSSLAGYDPDVLWERLNWVRSLPVIERYEWLLRRTMSVNGKLDVASELRLERAREKAHINAKFLTRTRDVQYF